MGVSFEDILVSILGMIRTIKLLPQWLHTTCYLATYIERSWEDSQHNTRTNSY